VGSGEGRDGEVKRMARAQMIAGLKALEPIQLDWEIGRRVDHQIGLFGRGEVRRHYWP
jgi:hypothetical protein